MRVLLHTCCAPCLIYPYSLLRAEGNDVTVYFYNPNIHPFREFKKRQETLKNYAESLCIPCVFENEYGLLAFLRKSVFNESKKCSLCYTMRIEKAVNLAKNLKFDAFSTTLLYSKYQKHDLIISICKLLSTQHSIPFLYTDFREGWQIGVDKAVELNLYRQAYCGCIYSEQERYDKSLRKG
jgi:predicted adenine nucleotide alpha hydrolase (AANH) superfamily ATPase